MAFYGSNFFNETSWNTPQIRHARHIACPQRLKYIHNIQDGYIPYVEDSDYTNRSSYRNVLQRTDRSGLYNTADVWRKELMGLAQQVQSSLLPVDESQQSRLIQHRPKRITAAIPTSHMNENNERNISKRLLSRRANTGYQYSHFIKPKIAIDKNEQESSTNNKNRDPGIWLLPILCYTLKVDNILDAQDWLVSANPTEKRLAMELISRTMHDMQNHESSFRSDITTPDQSSTSSNLNNLYWPYKFWQHQHQPKLPIDNNGTRERATSPVRILTPTKRLSTSLVSDRPDQSSQTNLIRKPTETRCSSSRLSTPMTANSFDRSSRRSYRIKTSRSISTDDGHQSISTDLRGKTPLI